MCAKKQRDIFLFIIFNLLSRFSILFSSHFRKRLKLQNDNFFADYQINGLFITSVPFLEHSHNYTLHPRYSYPRINLQNFTHCFSIFKSLFTCANVLISNFFCQGCQLPHTTPSCATMGKNMPLLVWA